MKLATEGRTLSERDYTIYRLSYTTNSQGYLKNWLKFNTFYNVLLTFRQSAGNFSILSVSPFSVLIHVRMLNINHQNQKMCYELWYE